MKQQPVGQSCSAWQYSAPVEPWVPLFIVLVLGKLGLCLTRTASAASLPVNLALTVASETSFIALTGMGAAAGCGCLGSGGLSSIDSRDRMGDGQARATVRLCGHRRRLLLLRVLLVPSLQVLAIADFIYIALVGIPLRPQLVAFFISHLFSDYVQQILYIYVGVGVPVLVASLLVLLAISNHLLSLVVAAIRVRRPAAQLHSSYTSWGSRSRRRLVATLAVVTLLTLTAYSQGLSRHGSGALRYSLCGNVFTRGTIELMQSAASSIRIHEEENLQIWPEMRVDWTGVSPRRRNRNVVVIGLETARVDAFSPWRGGNSAPRTPFMEALAQRGRIVQQAYTPTPNTVKAIVAIFCGLTPAVSMEWSEFGAYNLSECVPSILRRAGFATAVFTGGALNNHAIRPNDIDAMGFGHAVGYEQLVGSDQKLMQRFDHVNHLGVEDDAIIEPSVAWAKQQAAEASPFFLGMFTVTTHAPYELPSGFKPSFVVKKDDPRKCYDATVEYTDRFLQRLFAQFQQADLIADTLFIIAGDHGEMFGEHLQFQHGSSLHEQALRVPLVIVGPDTGPPGTPIEGLRSLLDVAPTVLEWLGVDTSGGSPLRTGSSLLGPEPHEELSMFSFFNENQLALRYGGSLKLIVDLQSGSGEVFDLDTDPNEEHDISNYPEHKAGFRQRVEQLRHWRFRINQIVAASKKRMTEQRRHDAGVLRYKVSRSTPAVASGVYEQFAEHSNGGVFGSAWGCKPCFTQMDGEYMFVVCDAGNGLSWMLAKRFQGFDAVYYTAPISADTSARIDAVSADRNRCRGLPTVGWQPQSFAYFRFGDLDRRSQEQLRALDGRQSKTGAHMAGVVENALGDGAVVANASLLALEARDGALGAKFSLVFPLVSQPASTQHLELLVRRYQGPTN